MNATSIMIVGVGGQGTLLASKVIGDVAVKSGRDVKVSEVHGMSQRGGSVVTYVKIGEAIHSPLVEKGEADSILAFEQLEAMRWAGYLKPDGKLIVSAQKIDPMPVITGQAEYPKQVLEKLKSVFPQTIAVDALQVAKDCGNLKTANTVMVGVLAKTMDIPKDVWLDAIRDTVPERFLAVNEKAFLAGYESAAQKA